MVGVGEGGGVGDGVEVVVGFGIGVCVLGLDVKIGCAVLVGNVVGATSVLLGKHVINNRTRARTSFFTLLSFQVKERLWGRFI